MQRKALIVWIVGVGLIALVLAGVLVSAAITAAILVDRVPGGDAGLSSTPALDGAYATMSWSLAALVVVAALGVSVPLIARRVSRRPSFR